MCRTIIFLLFVLTIVNVNAQSINSQVEPPSLVQRVDSLEHELSYLKFTYDLSTLRSDIDMFSNEVNTKSIAIQLNLYGRNFDKRLGESYKRYYEACLEKQDSFLELIESQNSLFTVKIITYPYTDLQTEALIASYKVIKAAYTSLESSMELLKLSIDAYWNYM